MEESEQSFTVHQFGVTCRSKKEVYDILTVRGGYYLPLIEQANSDYISDILSGEKLVSLVASLVQVVKCKDVINRRVPQIEGLRVSDMIKFAREHIDIDIYLPKFSQHMQCERKWLANLNKLRYKHHTVNSLIPDEFNEFVMRAIEKREDSYIEKNNIRMNVKPEFVNLFRDANTTSKVHGKFYHYVNSSKIRRQSRINREEAKQSEELQIKENELKDKRLKELEDKLDSFDRMKAELDDYTNKLQKIYERGLINEDGYVLDNPDMKKICVEEDEFQNSEM